MGKTFLLIFIKNNQTKPIKRHSLFCDSISVYKYNSFLILFLSFLMCDLMLLVYPQVFVAVKECF